MFKEVQGAKEAVLDMKKFKIYGCTCGQAFFCKNHLLRHIREPCSKSWIFWESEINEKPNEGIGFFIKNDDDKIECYIG